MERIGNKPNNESKSAVHYGVIMYFKLGKM